MGDVDQKFASRASAKGLASSSRRSQSSRDLHAEVLARSTEITANHDAVKGRPTMMLRAGSARCVTDVQRA